jgi:exosortase/archaeosortase family protein
MKIASAFFINVLYEQSTWVVTHILNIKITEIKNGYYCENGAGLVINEGCSGIKQILQFAVLMLIFPGPWKHKAWFIPLGMFIVHLTNVLRIVLITIVIEHWPANFQTAHDTYLRVMFYVVIFALWLFWVEKIAVRKPEKV